MTLNDHRRVLLRLDRLAVRYPGAAAARPQHVSFTISPGEVVLVLGPSGSGKSTLTLAVNGLVPHSIPCEVEGTVTLAGHDTASTATSVLSQHAAMVFQDPDAQICTATVYDEVAFGLENLRMPVAELERRCERALRAVGLWERRGDAPEVLSGGGRQRLAIACAVAGDAQLLVLDEPTANLDVQGIADVYDTLAELISHGDRAVLLVEHNVDAALHIATRAIVLDDTGAIAFDGPPAEVLRTNADALHRMGVWLPSAMQFARTLGQLGSPITPMPLTAAELAHAVPTLPTFPALRGPTAPAAVAPAAMPASARPTAPTAEPATAIEAAALVVRRGRREVLRGVDLQIARGEMTAIIGANGAGKTTLLHTLAGVIRPQHGTVLVDGMSPSRTSPRELSRHLGFVFQNPEHQFVTGTVFDELAHGLRLRRLDAAEIEHRVGAILDRFGLTEHRDAHPFRLSGGEKRRLSVGTALITQPAVLVLDEPTFGQDRARATELMTLLDDLRAGGTTIVLVTHDLELVAAHSDNTVVLCEGRVRASGATACVLTDDAALHDAGIALPPLLSAVPPSHWELLRGAQ